MKKFVKQHGIWVAIIGFAAILGALLSAPSKPVQATIPLDVAAAVGQTTVGVSPDKVAHANSARQVIAQVYRAQLAIAEWEAKYRANHWEAGAVNEITQEDLDGATRNITVSNLTDVSTLAGQMAGLFTGPVMEKVHAFRLPD